MRYHLRMRLGAGITGVTELKEALSLQPMHVSVGHSRRNILDPPLGRPTELANDARHPY